MSYADKLNPEQKKAVQHAKGPLLIVAGAGTGKTTVITERINWLITKQKIQPEEVLALTFTEKAAAEMEERVDRALPMGYVDLWISTFHAFAERILKKHGLEVGLTTEFKVLDQTAAWLLVRNNLNKFDLDYYKPLGNPNKFIHALLKHFSKAKDEMVEPKDYLKYAESYRLDNDLRKDEDAALEVKRLEEVANAYHVYQQLLLDNDYLDFGDLINYCYELFQKRPKILKQYQNQFKYVLVDEFQDTNYAQYQLIKLLALPQNNITVVGDDDQSIYKFRGASISNILEFKKDFPKSAEVYLSINYRTKQNILDLAYKFIQLNNPNRLEAQLKIGNKKLSKELKSPSKSKGTIEHLHLPTADEEVAKVINKIGSLYKKDPLKNNWSNFAILVRANNQAKPFIEGLERAGIPYQFVASKGLYAKPVILNLVAFLKLLDDFHESDAMYRYLTMPIFKMEQEEIIKITHQAYKKRWNLYEVARQARALIRLSDVSQAELDKSVRLLEKFISQAKNAKTSRIIFDFLNESGYLKYVDSLDEFNKRQQFSYLGQFYRRIKVFEELNDDKSVKNFLKQLGLEIESGEQGDIQPLTEDESPEMVKVMTVHGAKGLEFKHVFLVNMVDRRFPTSERKDPILLPDSLVKEIIPEGNIHLQEERRLFYVGMTRAKEGLYFTSAEDYGGVRKKKISVFLDDLRFSQSKQKSSKNEKLESIEKIKPTTYNLQPTTYKYPLPTRFSFSQLSSFKLCKRAYFYNTILKVPSKGNFRFSFGSTIHLALQKFYEEVKRRQGSSQVGLFDQTDSKLRGPSASLGTDRKGKKSKTIRDLVSLDYLLNIYQEVWIDDWYESVSDKNSYFKKGKDILKRFYESDFIDRSLPAYLEKGFGIKIQKYMVTGKIDRIDEFKDGYKIIDYKTGKPKDKLRLEDKRQLILYQMAANTFLDGKIKELSYYYLENEIDNIDMSFVASKEDIKETEEFIVKTIEEIKNCDWEKELKNHKPDCFFCKDII